MMKSLMFALLLATSLGLALPPGAAADVTLAREDISWTSDATTVAFTLRFRNLETTASGPVSGQLFAQEFGAFLPNVAEIGTFDIPTIMPDSFFDVFMEVSRAALPPSAEEMTPWGSLKAKQTCSPDLHWDGNVDVIWAGPGGAGQIQAHLGTLQVCPGYGSSCIHLVTNCAGWASWAITGLCPGFSAALVNEDLSPAPNPVPPNWSGHICITADATVTVGSTCCLTITFTCMGVPIPVQLCVEACDCEPIGAQSSTWGGIRCLYR